VRQTAGNTGDQTAGAADQRADIGFQLHDVAQEAMHLARRIGVARLARAAGWRQ
jgi:hypothetical protein